MIFKRYFPIIPIISLFLVSISPQVNAHEEKIVSSKNFKNNKEIFLESPYILGPGDSISISFRGLQLLDVNETITPQGYIYLDELSEFKAAGLTIKELKKELTNAYKEFIYEPEIQIRITKYKPISVYLRGEIRNPGLYNFEGYKSSSNSNELKYKQVKLFDLIQQAGGINNYADLSKITIIRQNSISQGGGKIKSEINLLSMLLEGDQKKNISLFDKDNILVKKSSDILKNQILKINRSNISPAKITVYITGNVEEKGPFEIKRGSSLLQALASSGGKKLWTGNIEFLRFNDDGSTKFDSFKYNPKAVINSSQNPILMEGDIINVEKTLFGKTTTVLGEVTNPFITILGVFKILDDD